MTYQPTEQDKQMRCRLCGRVRSLHMPGSGLCTLSMFQYDPNQPQNYRSLCANCGMTGQGHVTGQGCKNFTPKPWDERHCLHCNHFAFYHQIIGKDTYCLGKSGTCLCKKFEPKTAATAGRSQAQTPVLIRIGPGDGLDCPRCGKNPAHMYEVVGLDGYIDACPPCAPAAALDALANAGVAATGHQAPARTAGRYAGAADPHKNCAYTGMCVAHLVNRHVKSCV